jgi:hypothetical protein
VVKDFRAVQLKKRRKLLRFINKENKIQERRRYQFNLKVEERPTDFIHLIRPYNSENDVFNMFFDESANLVQDTNEFRSQIFANDFDFKEDSELFSKTTIMTEKSSLFAQEFINFEFEGVW